jgi:hypothetical protein
MPHSSVCISRISRMFRSVGVVSDSVSVVAADDGTERGEERAGHAATAVPERGVERLGS